MELLRKMSMVEFTAEELREAKRALLSLRNKSDKASGKLAAGSWQHEKMVAIVEAADVAVHLIDGNPADIFADEDLPRAHSALLDALRRAESVAPKFAAGTPQRTLQTRRIAALRTALGLVEKANGMSCGTTIFHTAGGA
jgi:hypothetical protein